MAMARERAATVRVDQATAVFSTKAFSGESARTADASRTAEPERVSESADGEGAAGDKNAEGDTRLRAAVAAWVSGADESAPADTTGSEGGSGSADDDGPAGGDDAADDTVDDTAASDADETGAGTDAVDADAAEAELAEEPGRPADSATAGSTSEAAGTSGTPAASDAASGTDEEATEPAADAADIDIAADEEPESGRKPEAAPEAASDETPADEEDEPASAAGDEPEDKRDTEPEDKRDAAPEGRHDGDGDSSDGPSDAPADAIPDAARDEPSDTRADEDHDAEAGKGSAAEPPVDQPTAVFKTPRRPAVDQPTTMLKLGGATRKPADGPTDAPADEPAGKSADKASDKAAERPTAEPDAKPAGTAARTSKFVPLNRLDDFPPPARPKPAPAPSAKPGRTAAPGVTPKPVDGPAAATTAIPQVGPERTTQLPLPPKPPLDLLAELTNTPPPPQTPVRTLVRRVKIWTPLVLLLVVIFAVAQAFRPLPAPTLTLSADSTYTFGGGTLDLPWPGQGQSAIEVDGVGSLGTDGKQTPAPTASVAKIMTAYVILQEHPLKGNEDGEKITVDQQAEDESKLPDESTAALSKGQQFTERQMLQMLMIPSGNNVARLLARWDSDAKSFVTKMNAAAKDLGMTNTTYTDPSGLQKTTVSTATDQIKLAKEVMKNDVFRSIVGMAKADVPGLANTIYNNNDLLVKQVGVIGLKTGSSTPAGGNLVWAATKVVDGKTQTIYGAVMNQNAGTGKVWDSLQLALANSQKLIDKVQQSLVTATVVKKGQVVGYVDDQLGGRTPVVATKNMTAIGWPGLKTKLSIGEGKSAVPHTGKAGTVVGELRVGDGSSEAVRIPVALKSDLAEPGFGAKVTRVG
ncbi:D-alanyl-D-alanine carboxypeptidase [Streptomyces sp. NPDC001914]|uniref:D-alanyl-D-alanine carboxypeptidase n=1 Tax=Streptomyces sp. NPDC001914 TaxID=3364623 RepID=UPI0036AC558E